MFQTSDNSQLLRRVLWINAELTIVWSLKHKNTQPSYIFNRENPQNSEPQNGPRRGLDFIALKETAPHTVRKQKGTSYLDQNKYWVKVMKSSPLLGPFCGSEFWGFSLLNIPTRIFEQENYSEIGQTKLWSQVPSLDYFVVQNSGDFLCWKYKEVVCFYVSNLLQ